MKTIKVNDIKKELKEKGLSTVGNKDQLIHRLNDHKRVEFHNRWFHLLKLSIYPEGESDQISTSPLLNILFDFEKELFPYDILTQLLSIVSEYHLNQLALISPYIKQVIQCDEFWHAKIQYYYGNNIINPISKTWKELYDIMVKSYYFKVKNNGNKMMIAESINIEVINSCVEIRISPISSTKSFVEERLIISLKDVDFIMTILPDHYDSLIWLRAEGVIANIYKVNLNQLNFISSTGETYLTLNPLI